MVPIHESDVAENRWKDSEWRDFELWERIEHRLRRKRTWIIGAVALTFISILAVPIIRDRLPKWTGLSAMRSLAVRANQMKVDAASLGFPLRLRILDAESGPQYVIEKVASCDSAAEGQAWGQGPVFSNGDAGRDYKTLTPEIAHQFKLERVSQSLCYDPLPQTENSTRLEALGIITVKDLAESRLDRVAFLNFSGLFAEIDFD